MSWQSKSPSIRLSIDKSLFNKLISVLDFNISLKIEEENLSSTASKLKEKLMIYSVPRINEEDNTEFVDVRFFPNEAGNMIWQLLSRVSSYIENEDYYNVLKENRKKIENK